MKKKGKLLNLMTETEREQKEYMSRFVVNPEDSSRIDCVICEADFYTSHPNPRRVSKTASEIHRYLKYKLGGKN